MPAGADGNHRRSPGVGVDRHRADGRRRVARVPPAPVARAVHPQHDLVARRGRGAGSPGAAPRADPGSAGRVARRTAARRAGSSYRWKRRGPPPRLASWRCCRASRRGSRPACPPASPSAWTISRSCRWNVGTTAGGRRGRRSRPRRSTGARRWSRSGPSSPVRCSPASRSRTGGCDAWPTTPNPCRTRSAPRSIASPAAWVCAARRPSASPTTSRRRRCSACSVPPCCCRRPR